MNSFILSNARIITPTWNAIGSLVVEDGLITDILKGKNYPEGEDMHGLCLAPGCIDIHSDYLEREINPRSGTNFPLPMAFHFMDQRAAACGITTVFSAISFSENENMARSFENAIDRAVAFDTLRQTALVRHFVHARLDPNSESVVRYLEPMKASKSLRLVVYNESIPGQRQFQLEDLVVRRARMQNISVEESRTLLAEQIAQLSKINHRPEIMEAFQGLYALGSHDDTTQAHVAEAKHYGATLSEMPTTLEAVRKAKEMGMWVCMGAPNYVRGGSHCGNLSCKDAMQQHLTDMICSDYHFPSMLSAVIMMMEDGVSPSQAVAYTSLNPARFLQMDQTIGSIEVGKEADLITFKVIGSYANVHHVWVRGYQTLQTSPPKVRNPVDTVKL